MEGRFGDFYSRYPPTQGNTVTSPHFASHWLPQVDSGVCMAPPTIKIVGSPLEGLLSYSRKLLPMAVDVQNSHN